MNYWFTVFRVNKCNDWNDILNTIMHSKTLGCRPGARAVAPPVLDLTVPVPAAPAPVTVGARGRAGKSRDLLP